MEIAMEKPVKTWKEICRVMGISKRHACNHRKILTEAGVLFWARTPIKPYKVVCMYPSEYKRFCGWMAKRGLPLPRAYKPRAAKGANSQKS